MRQGSMFRATLIVLTIWPSAAELRAQGRMEPAPKTSAEWFLPPGRQNRPPLYQGANSAFETAGNPYSLSDNGRFTNAGRYPQTNEVQYPQANGGPYPQFSGAQQELETNPLMHRRSPSPQSGGGRQGTAVFGAQTPVGPAALSGDFGTGPMSRTNLGFRSAEPSRTDTQVRRTDPSFDERLARLEESWCEECQPEMKEEAPSGKPTLNINGRIHFDHWSFADDSPGIGFFEHPDTGVDPEDRFFFRRIRLNFHGEIMDNMIYRMMIDFNTPESGEMKDMYIGFTNLPIFQRILIGNQKRPLGLDHLNSSRFNIFIERPLVVEAFNEDARRIGMAAYGVSDDEVYNWRYGVYALENVFDDGEVIGDSRQWSLNGRLASSPWYDECSGGRNYFHWAIAGMVARPDGDADPADTNANEGRFRTRAELRSDRRWINTDHIAGADWYEILGLESILNLGPLQIVGEYQFNWMQRDGHRPEVGPTPMTGPDLFFHGAYVYVAYMLTGEHVPYNRKSGTIDRVEPFENFFISESPKGCYRSGWGAWQVALRYSYLDLTDEDIRGGVEHNLTFALVWYFNDHASLQFNTVYGDIRDHEPVGGYTDGHFTALGTRLRVDF